MRCLGSITLCALLLLSSCGGPAAPADGRTNFRITGLGFTSAAPVAGDTVTLKIRFEGDSGPYNFTVGFDQAVTPNTATVSAPVGAHVASVHFTFDDFTRFHFPLGRMVAVSVTGTDANGVSSGPIVGNVRVVGTGT